MCTPALCALLWLGALPPLGTIVLGLVTTFAGYTAVYALNDVVDYRVDRRKVQREGFRESENYLDALLVRHPMAHGYISYTEGLFWMLAWSTVALCGAYLLNPVCILIFIAGCALEVTYCLLLKVSHLRVLVSGGVKTSGGVAAIFAVDPHPATVFVVLVFFWLFFWEIGGQNIPNDWADIEEDRHQNARTLPVRLGPERATDVILVSLTLTLLLGAGLFSYAPGGFHPVFVAGIGFDGRRPLDSSCAEALPGQDPFAGHRAVQPGQLLSAGAAAGCPGPNGPLRCRPGIRRRIP